MLTDRLWFNVGVLTGSYSLVKHRLYGSRSLYLFPDRYVLYRLVGSGSWSNHVCIKLVVLVRELSHFHSVSLLFGNRWLSYMQECFLGGEWMVVV